MRALHRKLLRDLLHVKGQAAAISLVIAVGVAMCVMYLSTFRSLRLTQETYYDRQRFADVFAAVKRAPLGLQARIADIPGVAQVAT
ncbi:MAG: ABC transporter permease, partial [Thermoanaerobaculia bacterium]|nr:ABC transporter permease [Thermoanaerobaculia bacterium]